MAFVTCLATNFTAEIADYLIKRKPHLLQEKLNALYKNSSRPVSLITSKNIFLSATTSILNYLTIVCPLTSQKKPSMITHVALSPKDCGIIKDSIVLCEQICVIDKKLVRKKLGEVKSKAKIEEFNKKLLISLGIEEY